MTQEPNHDAWQVAIALAIALPDPPDWAVRASGRSGPCCASDRGYQCELEIGHVGKHVCPADDLSFVHEWEPGPRCTTYVADDRCILDRNHPGDCVFDFPVPAPWDAAAYLADCARRKVEPGPLPSLEWTGPDGFGWKVCASEGGIPYVEFTWCGDDVASWVSMFDEVEFCTNEDGRARVSFSRELVARIVTMATAAKRARR